MPVIRFKATPYVIGTWTILRLPERASAKLPSRGQVMVEGTINGFAFRSALEPDGRWSHWFKVDKALQKAAGVHVGEPVTLAVEPTKAWPEPEVPADLKKALETHRRVRALWADITPMARWEWIRWIRGGSRQETRGHRIEVACSKLESGERRPCCWNRNACSEPSVSKNGILLDPAK